MVLFVFALIAILGACLLLYYQLGPKVTNRLKGSLGGASGFASGLGAMFGMQPPPQPAGEETPGADEKKDETGYSVVSQTQGDSSEGKVLFIFGDGERVERPIDGDGDKDS